MDGFKQRFCPSDEGPCEWVTFTQEFETSGNVEVLRVMRAEGALHNANPTAPITEPERVASKEFFCPSSPAWREACMARGEEVVVHLISVLSTKSALK